MGSIEAALQLAVIFATASLQPGSLTLDPNADVRMSLLAQPAGISQAAGDETVVRWQQSGEEIPSDLPDATEETDEALEEEPLDVPLEGDEEVLDAPLDEELLDVTVEEEEPLDAPLDGELPADDVIDLPTDDLIDLPVEEPALVAEAPVAAPKATLTLPPGFGDGDTIVLNPTGGNAAEVPEDCKVLVQNGRAVVGSGCGAGGDDDEPWWGSQVGALPPPSSTTAAGVPSGFPFDDAPSSSASSSPFGEGFPFNDGGAVITQPAQAASDSSNADDAPQVISAGPVDDGDEETRSFFNSNRDNDDERRRATRVGRATPARAAQSARTTRPARAANTARTTRTARADAGQRNPCQTAQVVAKKAKNKKQIAKARAKCRQYKKKAKRQARSEQPLVYDVRFI